MLHAEKIFKHYTVSLKYSLHTLRDCETWCSVAETKPAGHLFLYRLTPASGFWTIFCRFQPFCKSSSQFWKKKEMNCKYIWWMQLTVYTLLFIYAGNRKIYICIYLKSAKESICVACIQMVTQRFHFVSAENKFWLFEISVEETTQTHKIWCPVKPNIVFTLWLKKNQHHAAFEHKL